MKELSLVDVSPYCCLFSLQLCSALLPAYHDFETPLGKEPVLPDLTVTCLYTSNLTSQQQSMQLALPFSDCFDTILLFFLQLYGFSFPDSNWQLLLCLLSLFYMWEFSDPLHVSSHTPQVISFLVFNQVLSIAQFILNLHLHL